MNVHIALMGKSKEPILKGFQYFGIDKLYILHSQNSKDFQFKETAYDLKNGLREVGFNNVKLVQINPFDLQNIINSIIKIVEKENESSISINITGGTNLMAGAATSASFFAGVKAYYVLDKTKLQKGSSLEDQIIELPIPSVPFFKNLQETQMKILKVIEKESNIISNIKLRSKLKMSPQKLSYHVKELEKKGLVETKRGLIKHDIDFSNASKKIDKRILWISLTNSGKLLTNWSNT